MKTYQFIIVILITFGIAACGSRKKDIEKISALEKSVFTDSAGMNKEKAAELVKLYIGFADKNMKDSLSPVYIYKAAEMSINLNNGDDAIKFFDRIIKDYPDFYKVPEAYFLKGFVYEITFKSLSKAREAYTEFISKYPKHELTDDAQISLDNLGKTPEQIILEAQNKEKARQDSLTSTEQSVK